MNMVNLLCSRYHIAEPITRMIFGGSFKGMDIDRLMRQSVANNNDLPTLKNFIQSQGIRQSASCTTLLGAYGLVKELAYITANVIGYTSVAFRLSAECTNA